MTWNETQPLFSRIIVSLNHLLWGLVCLSAWQRDKTTEAQLDSLCEFIYITVFCIVKSVYKFSSFSRDQSTQGRWLTTSWDKFEVMVKGHSAS